MENQEAICLTFGEQSENHVGMNINGSGLATNGFSVEDLLEIKSNLETKEIESDFFSFDSILENIYDQTIEAAAVLIIRNGVEKLINESANAMLDEHLAFNWDTKYWDRRRQRVLNKKARYNVCYGENSKDPNYEKKQGTIVGYNRVPILNKLKNEMNVFFGEKAKNLEVEGNLYYDVKKCGIGFHGDSERKKVIACSLGAKRPIHWQWYLKSKPIGERIKFEIGNGDIYIMSEKATGFDWKKRSKITLRHAAGEKYV